MSNNKQLKISFKGNDYILEYTRRTVQQMERSGFNIQEIDTKPTTVLPQLFAGAFQAHHRFLKQEVIDDIFKHLKDKESLFSKLAEMYNDPALELLEEPEDDVEGNADWTVNW